MTRMTRPDCAVMCNLINTYTHTHTIAEMITGTRMGTERAEERRRSVKKTIKSSRRDVGNRGDLSGKRRKNVDKKGLVQ